MEQKYGFFNDVNGDRTYMDDQMAAPFGALAGGAGVSPYVDEKLLPSSSGLQVKIAPGFAFGGILPGWWYRLAKVEPNDIFSVTLDSTDPGKKRIDTVVVRFDRREEVRTAMIEVVKGDQVDADPKAEDLVKNKTVYELSLCEVLVEGDSITSLTDTRVMIPVSGRDILTADRTYYVSNDGKDNNSGLETSSPFKTIQHAIDVVSKLDLNGYTVHIDLWTANDAAVVYDLDSTLNLKDPIGVGVVVIHGDEALQNNVTLAAENFDCINAKRSRKYILRDFKCEGNGAKIGLIAPRGSEVNADGLNFKDFDVAMLANSGRIVLTKTHFDTKFVGEFDQVLLAMRKGEIHGHGITFITTAIPELGAFAYLLSGSYMDLVATTYTKTDVAGMKYYVHTNSVLELQGAVVPGNTAGATAVGGQIF